jgi:MoaA/NifB/PqqE/SkfB family radical SAM enzyme
MFMRKNYAEGFGPQNVRCRHAFEMATVHANGDVVCSIIDGRGDFVLGNVYQDSLSNIFNGSRYRELRNLVLSTSDGYCRAIGKNCPLKTIPQTGSESPDVGTLRYLAIEPTTACDLSCLSCPVRDFTSSISWKDAYSEGGISFFAWDSLRRIKQHIAGFLRSAIPQMPETHTLGKYGALLLRGRIPHTRNGTLPLEIVKRVIDEAGSNVLRVDFFNYGEPFLYRHIVEALRYIRKVLPQTAIAISTNGLQVREEIEDQIINEYLLDWILFSIDGVNSEAYLRYRIGGKFENAFANLRRFHRKAKTTNIHVIWQYVVFNWNDSDDQLQKAIEIAESEGITLWFDFAGTWGRSKRNAADLSYVTPYLKPYTALPREPRQEGW